MNRIDVAGIIWNHTIALQRRYYRLTPLGEESMAEVVGRFPTQPGRDVQAAIAHLNANGIIPRQMGGYGLPDCVRITIGLEDDNEAVVEALTEFMGQA